MITNSIYVRIPLFVGLLINYCAVAQEVEQENKETPTTTFTEKGYLSIVLGHAFIPAGEHAEEREAVLSVPTWGIDLGFRLSHRWALVWGNEIHLQQYLIRNDEFEELVREYPVITSIEAQYYINHRLAFLFGPGVEIERNQSFFVFRVGLEGEIEMGTNDWLFIPSLFYETKEGKFGSFTIGFGAAKLF